MAGALDRESDVGLRFAQPNLPILQLAFWGIVRPGGPWASLFSAQPTGCVPEIMNKIKKEGGMGVEIESV